DGYGAYLWLAEIVRRDTYQASRATDRGGMRPTHSVEELADSFTALVVEELLPTHPRHMTIGFPELETWGEEELDRFRQLTIARSVPAKIATPPSPRASAGRSSEPAQV